MKGKHILTDIQCFGSSTQKDSISINHKHCFYISIDIILHYLEILCIDLFFDKSKH